jgi:hypothetical protein
VNLYKSKNGDLRGNQDYGYGYNTSYENGRPMTMSSPLKSSRKRNRITFKEKEKVPFSRDKPMISRSTVTEFNLSMADCNRLSGTGIHKVDHVATNRLNT